MGQSGYRGGPVMPGQVPAINREFSSCENKFTILFFKIEIKLSINK